MTISRKIITLAAFLVLGTGAAYAATGGMDCCDSCCDKPTAAQTRI